MKNFLSALCLFLGVATATSFAQTTTPVSAPATATHVATAKHHKHKKHKKHAKKHHRKHHGKKAQS